MSAEQEKPQDIVEDKGETSDEVREEGASDEVAAEAEQSEQQVEVVVRLPTPSNSRTLPKPVVPESYASLTLLPQASETIQDLKLAINEWVGGYWLGPYSLRFPIKNKSATGRGEVLGKGRDGIEIREGEKLSEWLEVGDVFGHCESGAERILEVVREPYSEVSARQSVLRLLEIIAPAGTTAHHMTSHIALLPGATIFESVRDGTASSLNGTAQPVYEEVEVALPSGRKGKAGKKEVVRIKREIPAEQGHAFSDWKGEWKSASLGKIAISQPPIVSLACLKSIQMSAFNPPPPHLRQLGHQLYLQVTLLEGEVLTLICTSRGWYVSKSNVNNFDSSHRSTEEYTHSLVDLLHSLSPQFSERIFNLSILSSVPPPLEPISTVLVPQAEPAYSWLATVPKPSTGPELLRTQLAYLHTGSTGPDGLDGARDWNEEIQGIKELPRESMQERVLREKMAQKTWAEFTHASIRGVLSVARGDVIPLNPNEDPRGYMWLTGNIFVTKAVDSIETYSHLGGDAAARVSHGKDAQGVKLLNKLDVDGVSLLGHTVVDYNGERWVCQSVLPGIFSRREDEAGEKKKEDWVKVDGAGASPSKSLASIDDKEEPVSENPLIIYGLDSEHLTAVHWDEATHKVMEKIGSAYKLAPHKVADFKGDEKEFYASAEVKGLRGSDGRRYLLDLPRISPVDVEWLEKDTNGKIVGSDVDGPQYPHRVVLLRPELIETFWSSELKRWARGISAKEQEKKEQEKKDQETKDETELPKEDQSPAVEAAVAQRAEDETPLDASVVEEQIKQFELRFNADAFVDQAPSKTADPTTFVPSKVTDESDPSIKAVRDASVFLRDIAIPAIALDVMTGVTSFIEDGWTLSKHLHLRGVNIRYLGYLASSIVKFSAGSDGQEKKATGHLKSLKAVYNPIDLFALPEPAYVSLTPESLRKEIVEQVQSRFRWTLEETYLLNGLKKVQLLRELAMRAGFQLLQRDYHFEPTSEVDSEEDKENKHPKDKKKKKVVSAVRVTTFEPADVLTLLPIVKSTAPTVTVAEEIMEAGRSTINRGNVEMGLEFMLEAITLYEQIHSVIHPEVASAYNQYASALHQLARIKIQQLSQEGADHDQPLGLDIATGLRLQRQGVIIAERTLGVYHPETASYYFQLAMLENLEGNYQAALKYFRHSLSLWDIIHGPSHPEITTVLSNAGVVLQALNENTLSLTLLLHAQRLTAEIFGDDHLSNGVALHQLTQAYFLAQDLPNALDTATRAMAIFEAKYGKEHAQTKEVGKNVELLNAVVENVEKQKEHSLQQKKAHAERLAALSANKKRVVLNAEASTSAVAGAAPGPAVAGAEGSKIGERGHLDVDDLVKFIQGQGKSGGGANTRGKNSLRGKRRTGAKR
ncbi:protein TIF31, partial [Tremellales sp. Uapishka_1]